MGETGYSREDYTTWPVVAYLNEQAANEHAAKAEARAAEIYPRWERRGDSFVQVMSGVNEHDPNMERDGETTYTVFGVDVADAGLSQARARSGKPQEVARISKGAQERARKSPLTAIAAGGFCVGVGARKCPAGAGHRTQNSTVTGVTCCLSLL